MYDEVPNIATPSAVNSVGSRSHRLKVLGNWRIPNRLEIAVLLPRKAQINELLRVLEYDLIKDGCQHQSWNVDKRANPCGRLVGESVPPYDTRCNYSAWEVLGGIEPDVEVPERPDGQGIDHANQDWSSVQTQEWVALVHACECTESHEETHR